MKKGKNQIKLPHRNLRSGKHRLKITVYDSYGREDSARTRFSLR